MQIEQTFIEGLYLLTPKVFSDKRGYFMESYNHQKWFNELKTEFVQDNESLSNKNVLRGMHFQNPPFAQAKLVRVVSGSVLDIAVDLRTQSKTYGKHFKTILSAENKKQLFLPQGFAHGFLCLEDNTLFSYKCSDYYHVESEDILSWNDPYLAIDWGVEKPVVSDGDDSAQNFTTFRSPF